MAWAVLFWTLALSTGAQPFSTWHQSLWWDGFVVTASGINTMTNSNGNLLITDPTHNSLGITLQTTGGGIGSIVQSGAGFQFGINGFQATVDGAGGLTANSFIGNGALLTSLNAGNISSGTLAVARGGLGNGSGNGSGLTNIFTKSLTNVFYVSTGGNDSTAVEGDPSHPWLSPVTALVAANAAYAAGTTNNKVNIGVGSFDLGTNVFVPTNGVEIAGDSPQTTWILSEADNATNGPTCGLNSGVIYHDMSVWGTLTNGTNFQYEMGMSRLTPSTNWVNNSSAWGYNLDFYGDSDNIYIDEGGNDLNLNLYLRNINFHSRWDVCIVGSTINTATNLFIDVDGFTIHWLGVSSFPGNGFRGFHAANGTINARNGQIYIPANTNAQIALWSGGGTPTSTSVGIFQNIGISNNIGTNVVSGAYCDILLQAGTVGKKSAMYVGNIYKLDGSPLLINAVGAGVTALPLKYIPPVDPSQIIELTNAGGFVPPALSLPTRAVNLGGLLTATNGISTLLSNLVAPTSITAPLTTVNWTNPINADIEVYIDNSGVTGTSIKKNGTQIFSSLIGDVTIGLQPNETINLTYTVGTPSIKWSPR